MAWTQQTGGTTTWTAEDYSGAIWTPESNSDVEWALQGVGPSVFVFGVYEDGVFADGPNTNWNTVNSATTEWVDG